MTQYIDKSAIVARIEKLRMDIGNIFNEFDEGFWEGRAAAFLDVIRALDTLEVKKVDWEEKFVSLQHIDDDRSRTCIDWGYRPNLYHFDGAWHVSWIHCSEGDTFMDFSGETIEEVVKKASDWFHSTFSNC